VIRRLNLFVLNLFVLRRTKSVNVVKFVLRIVSLVAVFALAVAGGYLGYNRYVNQKPAAAQTAVRLQAVTQCTIAATVATTGPLNPTTQAKLAFKSGGKLKELNVKIGDAVKAGQVLAKLDTTDLEFGLAQNLVNLEVAQLKLAQLKAGPTTNDVAIAKTALDKSALALQKAQSDYDKVAWRSDVGMSTQAQTLQSATLDYQSALANYAKATAGSTATDIQVQEDQGKTAQIAVDQARANLQGATIVAPFDGVISSVTANVGEQVSASPIITIIDPNSVRVEANIDETDIGKVAVGQVVNISFDSLPGVTLQGKVTTIAPSSTSQSGVVTYLIYVVPTKVDPRLRLGMTSTASIVYDQRTNVVCVPNRAIKNQRAGKTVQVYVEGQLVDKVIQTGLANDSNTEVTAGLAAGDQVAIPTTATNQNVSTGSLFGGGGGLGGGGGAFIAPAGR
jgi:RND family efflux transporter MFP subunit